MQNNVYILAIDPGRKKNGLAVVDSAGEPVFLGITTTEELYPTVKSLHSTYGYSLAVIGNGTASSQTVLLLEELFGDFGISFALQDEKHTTEEARRLYFKRNPPKGLFRLIPAGLLTPPTDYDDITALVIARRYLENG